MPDATAILAGMKAVCEAATKGPWGVFGPFDYDLTLHGHRVVQSPGLPSSAYCMDPVDADFIAAARTSWPATIRALEVCLDSGMLPMAYHLIVARILEGRDAT